MYQIASCIHPVPWIIKLKDIAKKLSINSDALPIADGIAAARALDGAEEVWRVLGRFCGYERERMACVHDNIQDG